MAGPAIEIFPMFRVFACPLIMTAPGEMILKRVGMMDRSVRSAPVRVSLNSAQYPSRCAVILWASSCAKKETVNMAMKAVSMT